MKKNVAVPHATAVRAKFLREKPRRTAGKITGHSWLSVKQAIRGEGLGNWSVAVLEDAVRSLAEPPPDLAEIDRKAIADYMADNPGAAMPKDRGEVLELLRLQIRKTPGGGLKVAEKSLKSSTMHNDGVRRKRPSRSKIPIAVQVDILFRDGWICRWCHRPTVFGPALKLMERFVEQSGYRHPLAYYDLRYRRDKAPMLDHLAAVIDHVEAFSKGGAHGVDNFVTACNKCNVRKNARESSAFEKDQPGHPVKGKYGEPKHWDGFVGLFMVLSAMAPSALTTSEKAWRAALQLRLGGPS